jgi:hypothetical protein
MSFTLASTMTDAVWLAAGAGLGIVAMTLRQKLHIWRERRLAAEWDPY